MTEEYFDYSYHCSGCREWIKDGFKNGVKIIINLNGTPHTCKIIKEARK